MNVTINSSVPSLVTGTFGASGTLSEEFDLTGYTIAGLLVDGAANGTLNFWVASKSLADGGTYRALVDSTGAAAAVTLPSGNIGYTATTIVNIIAPYRYVRLVASVAQGSSPVTTAKWIVKA